MSLTRKASSQAKKPTKPPRDGLAAALVERESELAQARRERTATSEILQVIASSPDDLQPVLDKIAETACRLCKAYDALVLLREGDQLRPAAHYGPIPVTFASQAISPCLLAGRAVIERRAIHIDDIAKHAEEYPVAAALASGGAAAGGMLWRANLVAPLMREGEAVGAIGLRRAEPAPFSEDQIELLKTFSHQAVIAIENTRLFRETQEALEQQKASADVLSVIGKSVSDAAPVFEAILEACQRLFGSDEIGVYAIGDDGMVRVAAWRGPRADEVRRDVTPLADSVTGRIIRERRTHHIPDLRAEPNLSAFVRERVERLGSASLLYAPMLWEERGLGSILVARSPPRPFSDREQALLQSFADQAAIAIENARLSRETQESLRQQTATSDILRVIASSPGDLQPVLDRLAETTCRLCEANDALLFLREGGDLRLAAHHGPIPTPAGFVDRQISRDWVAGRSVADREPIHVHDLAAASDEYPLGLSLAKEAAGAATPGLAWRTTLSMPLIREGEAVGAITLRRVEVWPFTDAQITLLRTFADQAVIAIENARLFDEVQARTRDLTEALQQQTATTNVLKVISRSAFDLDAVLKTLTDSARSLSGAATAAVFLRDGEFFPLRAESGVPHEFLEYMNGHPARPGKATLIGRVAMTGEAVLIPDALADPDYSYGAGPQIGNYRALFGAPMIRDGRVEGVFGLMHPKPSAFMPRQMEMVRAFADQAVIAIENARLFDEVQARTRDVEEALEQQKASAEILSVISNSVADAQPVFEKILHSVEHIFGAEERIVFLAGEDGLLHIGAMRGPNSERARALYPMPLETTTTGLAISERRLISFADVLNGPDVPEGTREVARRIGQNHALVVAPMLFEGRGIGSIVVARFSMRPFSEKECALLRTFADQAVIAIQNARLFNETREALEQQTAAGEILRVISSSPTDVQPVFDAIAHSAAGLCEATNGTVFRLRDGLIHLVGHYSLSQEQLASVQRSFPAPLDRGTAAGRAILGRAVVHIHDIAADAEYSAHSLVKTGLRSVLSVPMLRNGESIGSINVSREEARPFSARQIELLKTFADQAVIAVNNVGLFNETQEALERQTATADILKVIASSPTDVQPVFHAIATSAKALIGGASASVQRYVGDTIHLAAFTSTNPAADEALMASFPRPLAESAHFVLVRSGETAQFADTESEDVPPVTRALARLRHFRSMLFTPLMSNGAPIGIITVTRKEPGTFAAHHVQLLKTFADQAVIAVNNVGLFNETQEALRQQTATADVLKAISRTAFDLDTVLGTLISTAAQLSGAKHGQIFRRHGDVYRYAGSRMEVDEAYLRHQQSAEIRPGRGTLLGRVALEKRTVQIVDAWNDPEYAEKDQVRQGNLRAMLGVPLMRDGEPIGAFALARNEPVPFTQRQIELVTTFADQAVIAIENARLFDEVQAKTRDLEEALEHQTATSEVLSAISRSPTEVQPVFDAIARSATELCGATSGGVDRFDGELIHLAAHYNWTPEALAAMRQIYPATPGRGFASARAILTRSVVHIPDISHDPEYTATAVVGVGFRSVLAVPMLRDGEPIGAIALVRLEPRPFTARQIALLQTFAEQAVIAINNVRLFDEVEARTREVEEALAQQTATADVLKVISRSAFDLQTVLDTLAASAAGLIGANFVAMYLRRGDVIRADATFGASAEMIRYMSEHPQRPGRETAAGRVFQTGEVQNIPDVLADPDYEYGVGPSLANFRALLGVPMVRDGKVEGSFTLGRSQPGLFTRRQIELVQTFADQAVIAIENVRLFDEVQARTHDLEESLQQQTATANVLKVISRSAFDLDAVLKTLTDSARSLSSAVSAVVMLRDGDVLRLRAESGCDPQFLAYMAAHPTRASKETLTGRVFLSGEAVSIPDALADPDYNYGDAPQLNNYRALLGAPLIRDGKVEGVFGLMHPKPGGFTPRQMELVRTFADQAVIAIENARLLDEVQARTRDIEEALQQQTATADVLKVISRSTFDLQPVLDTLVESAARLCDTEMAFVLRRDGEVFRAGAAVGYAPEYMEYLQNHPLGINRGSVTGRVALEGRIVQIADVTTDPEYTLTQTTSLTGQRTALGVPLIRDGEVIGVIVLARRRVELFTERQIELVTTFADQAVIAISNVGLFNETQEALKQQTATADVLKVISRSAFDLPTVLHTLVESAAKLCDAEKATITREIGGLYYRAEWYGFSDEFMREVRDIPVVPERGTISGRALLEGAPIHVDDVWADPEYTFKDTAKSGEFRTCLAIPMLRNGAPIGVLVMFRNEVRPFNARQIELVQTFADQAVIAIENVRLFDEVQARTRDLTDALQQQTATADVLKVISRSAFDLQTVLETLITTAVELNEAHTGTVCVRDGDVFRYRAFHSARDTREVEAYLRRGPVEVNRGSIAGRTILSGQVEQIPDLLEDADYNVPLTSLDKPWRAVIGVPMLGKDRLEGVFTLTRLEPGPYSPRQIEILQTFADQAVIAIDNARLFGEVQARTKELAASLDDLQKAQDRLIQSEKLASLGQLTAGIAHEIKNPLNFINNFSALSRELMGELADVIKAGPLDDARREEAEELIGTIDGNLDKVVSHGKRADSIVKNMLLHSRAGSGERSTTNINAMVEEALNLAYHGARAEKPGFNVTIARSLDPDAGAAEVYVQEMTRVLLNLISNGFYATAKRKQAEADGAYEPTLTASTRDLGHSIEIAIRDNGIGIPGDVKAKMFNPFFTTKPAGEGTGLGLSLSHDIVVKQHGGTIEVSTEPGAYTQFTIVLPRAGPHPIPSPERAGEGR